MVVIGEASSDAADVLEAARTDGATERQVFGASPCRCSRRC